MTSKSTKLVAGRPYCQGFNIFQAVSAAMDNRGISMEFVVDPNSVSWQENERVEPEQNHKDFGK